MYFFNAKKWLGKKGNSGERELENEKETTERDYIRKS